MKKTFFNGYDLKKEFVNYERDYFSLDGYDALLNFYDEIDENMELDVISICGECTEYGKHSTYDFNDLIDDYGYIYTKSEYLSDNDITSKDFNQEDYISELITHIENKTQVLNLKNEDYIIFSF